MGTQIFLLLCTAGEVFMVYCLVQFGREWKKVHVPRARIVHIDIATAEERTPQRVIQITDRARAQYQHDSRRMAS